MPTRKPPSSNRGTVPTLLGPSVPVPADFPPHYRPSGIPAGRASRYTRLRLRQVIDRLVTAARRLGRRQDRDPGRLTVIALIAGERDRRILAGVCSRNGWNAVLADTCDEARRELDRTEVPVVLCDRDLPERDWRRIVETLAASPQPSCILLLSKVVDDYLRDEVVRSGGYDVLRKPLREDEVASAVRLAWTYWNSARPAAKRRSA